MDKLAQPVSSNGVPCCVFCGKSIGSDVRKLEARPLFCGSRHKLLFADRLGAELYEPAPPAERTPGQKWTTLKHTPRPLSILSAGSLVEDGDLAPEATTEAPTPEPAKTVEALKPVVTTTVAGPKIATAQPRKIAKRGALDERVKKLPPPKIQELAALLMGQLARRDRKD